ncbi:hypothetical protein [Maricaulis sp.]|uniref:hypothetical protein n=1 Tax=Maricaulis sp. TaxID=1486257 RepID=UPI003A90EB2D
MTEKTYELQIDPAQRLAVLNVVGPASTACLIQAFGELAADPAWQGQFDLMIKIGQEPSLESFTLPALEELQAFMRGWNAANRTGANPRTAIVCPDGLKRVIAELWAAMNGTGDWQVEINVFVSRARALRWLQSPAS